MVFLTIEDWPFSLKVLSIFELNRTQKKKNDHELYILLLHSLLCIGHQHIYTVLYFVELLMCCNISPIY